MPKLLDRPPKLSRHKASGRAYVHLDGRDHYLGTYGSKEAKRNYDQLVAKWLAAGKDAPATCHDDVGPTLLELSVDYIKWAKIYYRKQGEVTSEYRLAQTVHRKFLKTYADHSANSFGPRAFQTFRQQLIDEGYSRTTVNHYMRHIVRTFRHAAGNEKVKPELHLALKAVEPLRKDRTEADEPKQIPPVPDEVVESTLPFLPPAIAAMVRLQRCSAMRPGEVVLVRPCDIDRSGDVWIYTPGTHKTEHRGRPRVIPLGKEAQAVLAPYLLRSTDTYCFSPQETMEQINRTKRLARTTPLSCGNRPGTNRKKSPKRKPNLRYSVDSYRRRIKEVCKAHGISLWAPNQLRKLAATKIRKHCQLEAAQVILGHQSKRTTERFYAEPDVQAAVEVARKLG
jgi:integrase